MQKRNRDEKLLGSKGRRTSDLKRSQLEEKRKPTRFKGGFASKMTANEKKTPQQLELSTKKQLKEIKGGKTKPTPSQSIAVEKGE